MPRIYSLLFELHAPKPPATRQLVVPVDEDGLGRHVWPADRRKTLYDVEAGDELLLGEDRYRITEVRVYRSALCDNGQPLVRRAHDFLVR